MITRLAGTLESLEGLEACVRLEGVSVWYAVQVPAYLASLLSGRVGTAVEFHTLEYLESQGQGASYVPRLVGFASRRERRFYELLLTVEGFGPRKALRALAWDPPRIARAIAQGDVELLTQLPEVGRKTAEKMVLSLRGQVRDVAGEPPAGEAAVSQIAGSMPPHAADVVAALVALGDTQADAERRVRRALARDPSLNTTDRLLAAALAS